MCPELLIALPVLRDPSFAEEKYEPTVQITRMRPTNRVKSRFSALFEQIDRLKGPPAPNKPPPPPTPKRLPGVKAVIAVASGKGGVGKSTTAGDFCTGFVFS
jgi:Mrp family chromosome partitioning ATPase